MTWSVIPGPPISTETGSEYVPLACWRSLTGCWGASCPRRQSPRCARLPGERAGFPEEAAQMRRAEGSVDRHELLTSQCQRRHRLPSLLSWSVACSHSPGEQQCTLWNSGTKLKKALQPLQIITNPSAAFLPSLCD